jgi:hypothetical protein
MMQYFIYDRLRSTRFCVKLEASDPIHLQGQTKYLKIVAQLIARPLTHIINSFLAVLSFPDAWKVARINKNLRG